MVFYFVTKELIPGSLLQRFVDGDDEFRNSRFKLIPSVPKVFISGLLIFEGVYLDVRISIGANRFCMVEFVGIF